MSLIYNLLPICILLEVSLSMRNYHFPHGHFHGLAMQHDNYQHYDSSSSDDIVMHSHRNKYYRHRANSECSESRHYNKWMNGCKCSCAKCKKPKTKSCCKEFCAQKCSIQNNILVVPYPVPVMILNQSALSSTLSSPTTTMPTTTATLPPSRKTLQESVSTIAYYITKPTYKRFRIVQDMKLRRNMGNSDPRLPKFDKLPKYGIVPIPENLAIRLMQQIRNGQKKEQLLGKGLVLNKNLIDYANVPI